VARLANGTFALKSWLPGQLESHRHRLREAEPKMQGQARIAAAKRVLVFDESPDLFDEAG
jgi:hypothetical protein